MSRTDKTKNPPDRSMDVKTYTPAQKTVPKTAKTIGDTGEELVTAHLIANGWQIIDRQWRCTWGEIDVIALHPERKLLAFVEVKTRQAGNWDGDGSLAITAAKQAKLIQSAQLFLVKHSHWEDWHCRFDVALVRRSRDIYSIEDYIESAFTAT